jgi:hypothetical protein
MNLYKICHLRPGSSTFSLQCGCRFDRDRDGYVDFLACPPHAEHFARLNVGRRPELVEVDEEEQPPDWRLQSR